MLLMRDGISCPPSGPLTLQLSLRHGTVTNPEPFPQGEGTAECCWAKFRSECYLGSIQGEHLLRDRPVGPGPEAGFSPQTGK
jgi:hypothetical protein